MDKILDELVAEIATKILKGDIKVEYSDNILSITDPYLVEVDSYGSKRDIFRSKIDTCGSEIDRPKVKVLVKEVDLNVSKDSKHIC